MLRRLVGYSQNRLQSEASGGSARLAALRSLDDQWITGRFGIGALQLAALLPKAPVSLRAAYRHLPVDARQTITWRRFRSLVLQHGLLFRYRRGKVAVRGAQATAHEDSALTERVATTVAKLFRDGRVQSLPVAFVHEFVARERLSKHVRRAARVRVSVDGKHYLLTSLSSETSVPLGAPGGPADADANLLINHVAGSVPTFFVHHEELRSAVQHAPWSCSSTWPLRLFHPSLRHVVDWRYPYIRLQDSFLHPAKGNCDSAYGPCTMTNDSPEGSNAPTNGVPLLWQQRLIHSRRPANATTAVFLPPVALSSTVWTPVDRCFTSQELAAHKAHMGYWVACHATEAHVLFAVYPHVHVLPKASLEKLAVVRDFLLDPCTLKVVDHQARSLAAEMGGVAVRSCVELQRLLLASGFPSPWARFARIRLRDVQQALCGATLNEAPDGRFPEMSKAQGPADVPTTAALRAVSTISNALLLLVDPTWAASQDDARRTMRDICGSTTCQLKTLNCLVRLSAAGVALPAFLPTESEHQALRKARGRLWRYCQEHLEPPVRFVRRRDERACDGQQPSDTAATVSTLHRNPRAAHKNLCASVQTDTPAVHRVTESSDAAEQPWQPDAKAVDRGTPLQKPSPIMPSLPPPPPPPPFAPHAAASRPQHRAPPVSLTAAAAAAAAPQITHPPSERTPDDGMGNDRCQDSVTTPVQAMPPVAGACPPLVEVQGEFDPFGDPPDTVAEAGTPPPSPHTAVLGENKRGGPPSPSELLMRLQMVRSATSPTPPQSVVSASAAAPAPSAKPTAPNPPPLPPPQGPGPGLHLPPSTVQHGRPPKKASLHPTAAVPPCGASTSPTVAELQQAFVDAHCASQPSCSSPDPSSAASATTPKSAASHPPPPPPPSANSHRSANSNALLNSIELPEEIKQKIAEEWLQRQIQSHVGGPH